MSVTIKSLSSKTASVPYDANMTVDKLAEAFYSQVNAELVCDMTLIYQGRRIFQGERVLVRRDEPDIYTGRALADFGVPSGAVIHSTLSLRVGPIFFGRKIKDCEFSSLPESCAAKRRINHEIAKFNVPGVECVGPRPGLQDLHNVLCEFLVPALAQEIVSFIRTPLSSAYSIYEFIFRPNPPPTPVSLSESSASSSKWEGSTVENPYCGGAFRMFVGFPADYPFRRPDFHFLTPLWNPLVYEDGTFLLPGIEGLGPWSPACTMQKMLGMIMSEMFDPVLCVTDFKHKLSTRELHRDFDVSPSSFLRRARANTQAYAV